MISKFMFSNRFTMKKYIFFINLAKKLVNSLESEMSILFDIECIHDNLAIDHETSKLSRYLFTLIV